MNRRDFVNALMERLEVTRREADEVLSHVTELITETVAKGETVALSGFAKFARVERPARMGRNPATGETIKIKASRKARITPLKAFKDAVLAGKAAAKKAPAKKAATKAPAKKAPAKKASARKAAPAKKAPARKTAAKKAPAKKTTAKKSTAKKTAAKKTTRR